MMSAQALERATHGFRIGYRDGYANKPFSEHYEKGSFAHHDYSEGYKAGANALLWTVKRSKPKDAA